MLLKRLEKLEVRAQGLKKNKQKTVKLFSLSDWNVYETRLLYFSEEVPKEIQEKADNTDFEIGNWDNILRELTVKELHRLEEMWIEILKNEESEQVDKDQ